MKKPTQRPFLSPLLVIIFGILAVSTGSIFVRYAQVYAPSIVIAAYRLGLATVFLAPVALLRYRSELRVIQGSDRNLAIGSGILSRKDQSKFLFLLQPDQITPETTPAKQPFKNTLLSMNILDKSAYKNISKLFKNKQLQRLNRPNSNFKNRHLS